MTARVIPVAADDAFTAIANPRRRRVICMLARTSGDVPARDLADHIAAIEHHCHPDGVSSDQRASVYISLIQNHLDRLDTLGAVDHDDRGKYVRPTAVTRPLALYIRQLTSICSPPQEPRSNQAQLHQHADRILMEGDDA